MHFSTYISAFPQSSRALSAHLACPYINNRLNSDRIFVKFGIRVFHWRHFDEQKVLVKIELKSDTFNICRLTGFLGEFAKWRKATIRFMSVRPCFCLSVYLSVCVPAHMEQLGSHWADIHEVRYLNFVSKNCFLENSSLIKIWQE